MSDHRHSYEYDDDAPQSPKLEDLPKLPDALAHEMMAEHDLHHVDTEEKVVLPSALGQCAFRILLFCSFFD